MKTLNWLLTEPIETIEHVRRWFKGMESHGMLFHPEDSPHTVINSATRKPLFTDDEATLAARRIVDIYDVCESVGIDPCAIACELLGLGHE